MMVKIFNQHFLDEVNPVRSKNLGFLRDGFCVVCQETLLDSDFRTSMPIAHQILLNVNLDQDFDILGMKYQ